MRSIRFWKTEIEQLSPNERQRLIGAIETLFRWDLLKQEYGELDLIKRILEPEAAALPPQPDTKTYGNVLFSNHQRRTASP